MLSLLLPKDPPTLSLPQPTPPAPLHSFFDVQNDSHVLSVQSKHHITRAIQNGWAKLTVRRYSGSIKKFIRFCDSEGIPMHLRFLADEFVLCAFAASSAGVHSQTTLATGCQLSKLGTSHITWSGKGVLVSDTYLTGYITSHLEA
jgi:hypothetical protein